MAMTKDQIDELMRENGIVVVGKAVYALCNLVEEQSAAEEREACAKLCDENINQNADKYEPVSQYQSGCYITAEYLATAIRARGQE